MKNKIYAGYKLSLDASRCFNCTQLSTITIIKSNEGRIYHINRVFKCDLYGFSVEPDMICEEYIESMNVPNQKKLEGE